MSNSLCERERCGADYDATLLMNKYSTTCFFALDDLSTSINSLVII